MSPLAHTRTWSRSCDVAVKVYQLLVDWSDRAFAARVLLNAFEIPEHIAAGSAATLRSRRRQHLDASAEALAVLQTQLYLAAECGLVDWTISTRICADAAALAEQLRQWSEGDERVPDGA